MAKEPVLDADKKDKATKAAKRIPSNIKRKANDTDAEYRERLVRWMGRVK